MRKRYRKGKKVDEGHVIYQWQGRGSNEHLLYPRPNFSIVQEDPIPSQQKETKTKQYKKTHNNAMGHPPHDGSFPSSMH